MKRPVTSFLTRLGDAIFYEPDPVMDEFEKRQWGDKVCLIIMDILCR